MGSSKFQILQKCLRARPKEDCKDSPFTGNIYIYTCLCEGRIRRSNNDKGPAVLYQELMPRISSAEERLVPKSNMAKCRRDIFMDLVHD
jgi:hypothetical protein